MPTGEVLKMKRKTIDGGRRKFLRHSLLTGAAASAATVPLEGAAALIPEDNDSENHSGYRVSEHVKAYYRTLKR